MAGGSDDAVPGFEAFDAQMDQVFLWADRAEEDAAVAEAVQFHVGRLRLRDYLASGVGRIVAADVGGTEVRGRLLEVGDDWLRLADPGVVLWLGAVGEVRVDDQRRRLAEHRFAPISFRQLLRRQVGPAPVRLLTIDGSWRSDRLEMVGKDFLVLRSEATSVMPLLRVAGFRHVGRL